MGEIRASVTLENRDDRGAVYLGLRVETDVRRATVEGIVDTGAVSPRGGPGRHRCQRSSVTLRETPTVGRGHAKGGRGGT